MFTEKRTVCRLECDDGQTAGLGKDGACADDCRPSVVREYLGAHPGHQNERMGMSRVMGFFTSDKVPTITPADTGTHYYPAGITAG